uniref:Pre-mRNA-splicing factor 38 n=1 Tax=Parascaris equorum TaxID=6256 RepID=A0A914R8K2_PAREQ
MTGMCGGGECTFRCEALVPAVWKQLVSMINNRDSPYIRGIGFMYIRFCQPPTDLWAWMEPYLVLFLFHSGVDPMFNSGKEMSMIEIETEIEEGVEAERQIVTGQGSVLENAIGIVIGKEKGIEINGKISGGAHVIDRPQYRYLLVLQAIGNITSREGGQDDKLIDVDVSFMLSSCCMLRFVLVC